MTLVSVLGYGGCALALPDGRLAFELPGGGFLVGVASAMSVQLDAHFAEGVTGSAHFVLISEGGVQDARPPDAAEMTFDIAGMTFKLVTVELSHRRRYRDGSDVYVEVSCRLYLTSAPRGSGFAPLLLGPHTKELAP